ncbi:hypothetical protein [Mucilaginibacter auburnensis]|uniref:histidine kinase n=1 Tax=Mucilaginibacter auburnensis TaxID=1457233 RepID=A0A2H9VNL2_9SPHI|nr:hypothetical protein [Mucilaginibacter auburnensis]PJJ79900.1 hypothetical protein CLV57_3039 [Mucilaginibacter auburnensis]
MENYRQINQLLNDSSFFYTISIGIDSMYCYVSKNYDNNFKLNHGTLLGKHFSVTLHPEDVAICETLGAKCFSEPGKLIPATLRKHDGKGGFVTTQWEMQAYFDDNGQPAGIFCIGYNISEFVSTQNQLDSAHTQLDTIGFIQSHMVRKPLANIIGLSDLISEHTNDNAVTQLCQMLKQSSEELDSIIKNISKEATRQ